jgi:hypothetical protein
MHRTGVLDGGIRTREHAFCRNRARNSVCFPHVGMSQVRVVFAVGALTMGNRTDCALGVVMAAALVLGRRAVALR